MLDARPVTDGGYSRSCPIASEFAFPGPTMGRGPWFSGWLFVQPATTIPLPIQAVDHPPSPNDPPRAIRNSATPPPAEYGYRRDRAPRPARRATDVAAFRRGLSGWVVPEPTFGMLFGLPAAWSLHVLDADVAGRVDIAGSTPDESLGWGSMVPRVDRTSMPPALDGPRRGPSTRPLEVPAGSLRGLRADGYLFVATVGPGPS